MDWKPLGFVRWSFYYLGAHTWRAAGSWSLMEKAWHPLLSWTGVIGIHLCDKMLRDDRVKQSAKDAFGRTLAKCFCRHLPEDINDIYRCQHTTRTSLPILSLSCWNFTTKTIKSRLSMMMENWNESEDLPESRRHAHITSFQVSTWVRTKV